MSVTAYALLGFMMMLLLTITLFMGKAHPIVPLTLYPIALCIICGFSISDISEWVISGIKGQVETAAMFVFAVIFFSCMMDAGVFSKIVGKVLGGAKNVTLVCVLTVVATMIGHTDGTGATTYLLVIPPFLLVYQAMKIRPVVLMALVSITAGVLNSVPWGGPCSRVAAGLSLRANDVFFTALPGVVIGLICCFALAVYMARREVQRGAGVPAGMELKRILELEENSEKKALERPRLLAFNLFMTAAAIVILFACPQIPIFLCFAVAGSIALIVNYPGTKAQTERLKAYAPTCMTMAAVVLATGIYTGILNNSPVLKAMTELIQKSVSSSISAHINTLMGFLWAPLSTLGLGHNSTCNGILPIVSAIGAGFVTPVQVGATYLITFCPRVFVHPTTAAVYVGLGLSGVELKEHLRFSMGWAIGISTLCFLGSLLIGVIPV